MMPMKSSLINLARACLKLTIFLILAVLLVKPLVVEMISWGHGNMIDVVLSGTSRILGMFCKMFLICAGMLLNHAMTKQMHRKGILPFAAGVILTVLIYGAAQYLSAYLVELFAAIIKGMFLAGIFAVILGVLLLLTLFGVFSYEALVIIQYLMRDD